MSELTRDEMLAAYLGDELDAESRAAFEAQIAADPLLKSEVTELRRSLEALGSLGEQFGDELADHAAARRRVLPVVLRYAAVIAIAFGAGYVVRMAGAPAETADRTVQTELDDAKTPGPNTDWREQPWIRRAAMEYASRPEQSSFARSLIALARTNRAADEARADQ